MTALGIDLGGTKIAATVFTNDWQVQASSRVATPDSYDALIAQLAELAQWGDTVAGRPLAVGIGAAGTINPTTGTVIAANIPATGKPIAADIGNAIGRPVTYLNDSRAFCLSEAVFGAGRGYHTVMTLVLGTGVGGGIAIGGTCQDGPTGTGGEFGHMSASASLIRQYNLPIFPCGCGRTGCIETLISGKGLARLGRVTMGRVITGPDLIAARQSDTNAQEAWDIWCAFAGDLIRNLVLTVDPDCIILGGGLSRIPNICSDLHAAAVAAQLRGFGIPPILRAEGGDISGARGAAYAATRGAV